MLNRRGISRAVVLLAIIATALIIAILVPVAENVIEDKARDADELHVQTAENSAKLRFVQDGEPFIAIYDCENKKFDDLGTASSIAAPYGNTKEHEGQVIYVRVDKNGDVFTKWVYPEDYATELQKGH